MLKTTLKKLSNKNTNNLAIKSTFLFMSLFILMLVIFSIVLMIVFSHHSDNIITRSNTWALEQMATATDKYLFEKIDYLCDTYFNTNSENARIKKFFSNMNDMSFDEMKTMQQEISDIKKQNPFIDNVILYNGQFDSIVSSYDGIVYSVSDIRNNLSIQNRFFSYLDSINSDFYVPQDDNIMLENQKKSIIYVHYVSSNETSSFGKRNVNCVIMAVDIENIMNFIKDVDMTGVQCFAILDNSSKTLIHSEKFPEINSIEKLNPTSYNKIISTPSGSSRMKFQNTTAKYIWLQSKIKDWKYVYIISTKEWYEQILFVILCISFTAFIILLLLYFLMKLLSRKIYKPFNDVVDKAKVSLANESHSDNEIEFLNNLIDDFSQKRIELDSLDKKYAELHLHQTTTKIINGLTNDTPENILSILSHFGIEFSHKIYSLITIEFNEEILKTFSYEQSNFILYDVMDVLYETFNCIVSLSSSRTIDIVINDDRIDYDMIIRTIHRLIIEKSLINIFFCGETDNISQIGKLHEQSVDLIKYSYIYGFDNTFRASELIEVEMDNSLIDSKQIERIENALMNNNQTQFCDECNLMLTSVKRDNHSFSYAQSVVVSILSILCRTAKKFDISISEDAAFKKIVDNNFFDGSTVYLFELSDRIFKELSDKMSIQSEDRRYSLITDIKEYIREHITEDISLASVAQQFNISAGYLSKFFKENTDESFSKYMIEQKFTYASEALIKFPNRSITDIANELGYFDSAYFSRQFKAHYGVTPVQYRKMNH